MEVVYSVRSGRPSRAGSCNLQKPPRLVAVAVVVVAAAVASSSSSHPCCWDGFAVVGGIVEVVAVVVVEASWEICRAGSSEQRSRPWRCSLGDEIVVVPCDQKCPR